MQTVISLDEAERLKQVLQTSFKSYDASGNAWLSDQLQVAGLMIPRRRLVYFLPTRTGPYGEDFKVYERDCTHAIIFVDERRGATVRINGSFRVIRLRNCA